MKVEKWEVSVVIRKASSERSISSARQNSENKNFQRVIQIIKKSFRPVVDIFRQEKRVVVMLHFTGSLDDTPIIRTVRIRH